MDNYKFAKREGEAWQTKIIGEGEEPPDQLLPNFQNIRVHPRFQREALSEVMQQLGWIQRVIVNRRTGRLIDGHLRVELALANGQEMVPVTYVDLTEEEERLALATYDPLGEYARYEKDRTRELLDALEARGAATAKMLTDVANKAGVFKEIKEPCAEYIDNQMIRPLIGMGNKSVCLQLAEIIARYEMKDNSEAILFLIDKEYRHLQESEVTGDDVFNSLDEDGEEE
ncbi:MAG: ParB N-terminal domain-containing protein [Chlorobi bacterium]|nr:ParB N-terminal domain-containing protein [Chlorobiota bacterium]